MRRFNVMKEWFLEGVRMVQKDNGYMNNQQSNEVEVVKYEVNDEDDKGGLTLFEEESSYVKLVKLLTAKHDSLTN